MESVYRIREIIKFDERDYAILYFVNRVPYLEHRFDKNHEEHAYNSFVKEVKNIQPSAVVLDERRSQEHEKVRVFLKIENADGIRTYEGTF